MADVRRPMLLLDLDNTLFDTDRFIQDLSVVVAPKARIGSEEFVAQIPGYYRKNGEHLGHYMFSAHLGALGLRPSVIERSITPQLAGRDFTYPDVAEVIPLFIEDGLEVRVLTYGERRYQQLKLSCAPSIGMLAADIVLESKGPYVSRRYPGRRGAIVDDKRITGLPRGFTALHIDRTPHTKSACPDLWAVRRQLRGRLV